MAENRGFVRWVRLQFDKTAGRRMQDEAQEALERAGKLGGEELAREMEKGGARGARALAATLSREYKQRMATAKRELADATISPEEFKRKGREAAQDFNKSYLAGLKDLQAKGKITDLELAGATGRLKTVSEDSARSAGLMAGAWGKVGGVLGGIFAAGAVMDQARGAIEKFDELQASVRKLGGAARVTGTDLAFLEQTSASVQERFRLSIPFANELTGAMNKMAVRAGDANLLLPALSAWLDLAAANGLSAADAMAALQTTIIGQDEGLNKLGLSNPQQIYEQWAEAAGVSAAKMTDAQKAQAILNAVTEAGSKVQGEYGKYLESNAGQADLNAQRIDAMRARAGEALAPIRTLGQTLKEVLYANLLAISLVLGKIASLAAGTYRFTIEAITTPGEVWRRLWSGEPDRGPLLRDEAGPAALRETVARINAGTALDAAGNPYRSPAQQRAAAAKKAAQEAEEREKQEKEAKKEAKEEAKRRRKEAERKEAERVKGLWDNFDKFLQSQDAYDLWAGRGMAKPMLEVPDLNLERAEAGTYARTPLSRSQSAFASLFGVTKEEFAADAEEAAYNMASAFQDAFDMMRRDGVTIGNFFKGVFAGIAGFALQGLSQFAQGKAKENFAAAIEAAAYALGFMSHLNFASAGAAWSSAAQHTAAGAAWSAVAGGAGSARGAVTGGAGAVPPAVRDVGLSRFERSDATGPEVHVYVQPFDPTNPVQATQLGKAMDLHVHLSRPEWAAN